MLNQMTDGIFKGSPLSIRQNSHTKIYEWHIENYESKEKECWTI